MEFESKVSGKKGEISNFQTHIPKHVAKHMGLRKGDMLVWVVENDTITIKKKVVE